LEGDQAAIAGPPGPVATRSEVVTAQEQLRRRIAADIHDDTLQVLAEVAIRLDMLRTNHPELDQEGEFGELGSSVREAMDRLRNLMFNLAPSDHCLTDAGTEFAEFGSSVRE